MHVKKNVFNNFFNTMIYIKGEDKDNFKLRMDLKEYCNQTELEFMEVGNGKIYKPKAKFSFTME